MHVIYKLYTFVYTHFISINFKCCKYNLYACITVFRTILLLLIAKIRKEFYLKKNILYRYTTTLAIRDIQK